MTLWVVGQHDVEGRGWQFCGIFSTEAAALAQAADNEAADLPWVFIGPCELDVATSRVDVEWPGAYYPSSVEVRS